MVLENRFVRRVVFRSFLALPKLAVRENRFARAHFDERNESIDPLKRVCVCFEGLSPRRGSPQSRTC
eukprot:5037385-Pyramimonas_sp.AAC.1